jgi:hypothetical protein
MKKTPNYFWPSRPNVNFHKLLLTMKIMIILLVCGLVLPAYSLTPGNLAAEEQQQIKVSGTIVDGSTGAAMPGVNIQVKGTSVGAISDADGKYTINVTDKNATLAFSFIGYVPQEVALGGRTVIDLSLAAETTNLDEVVVVGYSTQKRANVVGSVASISGTTLQQVPSVNVSQSLGGRMSGISVIQQTGEPGQMNPRILVRGRSTLGGNRNQDYGSTNPLIVIDGVQGRCVNLWFKCCKRCYSYHYQKRCGRETQIKLSVLSGLHDTGNYSSNNKCPGVCYNAYRVSDTEWYCTYLHRQGHRIVRQWCRPMGTS